MKKIFVLGLLVMPIAANATDPVGPSAVPQGQTAVVATANAPYATATDQTGDSTTVVSASYVKGAYNDAIAAVNKVAARVEEVDDGVGDIEGVMGNRMDFIEGEIFSIHNDVSGIQNDVTDLYDQVDDKQAKLLNGSNNHNIESKVVAGSNVSGFVTNVLPWGMDSQSYAAAKEDIARDMGIQNLDDALISAGVVLDGLQATANDAKVYTDLKRVNAVTTWGSNNVTQLEFAELGE